MTITISWDDQFLEGVRLAGSVTADPSATPELAALTLLAITIAGMAGYCWRRRKQAVLDLAISVP